MKEGNMHVNIGITGLGQTKRYLCSCGGRFKSKQHFYDKNGTKENIQNGAMATS